MHTGAGIAIIVGAAVLLLVTALVLRSRLPRRVSDLLAAIGGAAVGIGGLLLLHRDVSLASWIATPSVLALGAMAHIRVLFGGSGPFRT